MSNTNPPLAFKYKNWEGKTAIRKVIPIKLWYGKTQWHPKSGWMLEAQDIEKNEKRDFAVLDIIEFIIEQNSKHKQMQ